MQLALAGAGERGPIGFDGDGRRTTTRLLDGEFPKYRALLPSEAATVASLETATLIDAVKRVALVAERNTPVRLRFADDEVALRAGARRRGAGPRVPRVRREGDPIEIAFNPHYLLDGLGASTRVARLAFTAATKPGRALRRPSAGRAPEYQYLLMPVRLAG